MGVRPRVGEERLATIYDVAKAAGVSPKTVSRVLNGDTPVNAKTRVAVHAAMERLNYIPSSAARSMRSQKSGLVGIITGAITLSPGVAEVAGLPDIFIVQGAQRRFADSGRTVLIADTGGKDASVPRLVQTFLEHRVEGLVYVAEYHQEVDFPAIASNVPVVLANCYDGRGTPSVLPHDEAGQHHLVAGLIERGHRRIGFLTLPESVVARALRLRGYQRALADAGIAFDPSLVLTGAISDPIHEYDFLWDALDRLLSLSDPPTVVCCGNDKMAIRVYGLLRQRGLAIPDDISVAGYDDYRLLTEQLHPQLTSVELPYRVMGGRAADRLLALIAGESKSEAAKPDLVRGPAVWRESVRTLAPRLETSEKGRTE